MSTLKEDDDHWGLPPQLPPRGRVRPARNHALGLTALAASILTLAFELRLLVVDFSTLQSEIPWLLPALIVTVVLSIAAGAVRARAYGIIAGVLVLLPILYLVGAALIAPIVTTGQ